ncbi:2-C-methyl-D-erythritol 4-phosphate cytidylyltransferase [Vibrio lentus]|uniref:2-C-methyl-D-erythritol 4-phosphate cytidylyltransferase n=1 Tax=Vibrio lentus TaxID=136468 RepID=A0A2N7IKB6_9VIBR|nr:2-C-methyl-D-erythritol 4-phosphate cytidylyltransferase [Vibrio lentus]PML58417.1 2-C-methyl-D-erythritol 4-phosphate cytidylyltransferase [Vibrio lentus]PMM24630.1 2-C-methyl-D-erythritol 4-phosphate cytidylyltransferase [Vibrio lentus]
MSNQLQSVIAVVPAAGVGSRMKADRPKQYLQIHGKTILEHTVEKLLSHPQVSKIVVAVSDDDPYYPELPLNLNPQVIRVSGGTERADSVLSALDYIAQQQLSDWVMVHDAARPCILLSDIDKLISGAMTHDVGAILAAPVRDTMKRSVQGQIEHTVDRVDLWHALTPQMFRSKPLRKVLSEALQQGVSITDEASAFEWKGLSPALIAGRSDNFKITQPEDLALAEFYLSQNKE